MHFLQTVTFLAAGASALATLPKAEPSSLEASEEVWTADHAETNATGIFTRGAAIDNSQNLPFINNFDRGYNIPQKKWDAKLAANAQKTLELGGGKQQVHKLYPGTYGQVLCPGRQDQNPSTGNFTPFGIAYYGWLCEVPTDPQVQADCKAALKAGWLNSGGQTGHHDILTNKKYTKIGCAFQANPDQKDLASPWQGIWGCDLA